MTYPAMTDVSADTKSAELPKITFGSSGSVEGHPAHFVVGSGRDTMSSPSKYTAFQ